MTDTLELLTVDSGRIAEWERHVASLPQHPVVTRHYFTPGIFAQEIEVRAAPAPDHVIITGAEHKTAYISVLSKGAVSVWGDDGEEPKLLRAPLTIVSPAGTRRMGLVHEDMIWTDFFPNPTEDRDIDRIMNRLVHWPAVYQLVQVQKDACLR